MICRPFEDADPKTLFQLRLCDPALRTNSSLRQVAMHESHGHGAFSDRGCAALHRAVAHIAGREHPGNTGLQIIGIAIKWPMGGPLSRSNQVRTCDQISRFVAHDSYFL